MKRREFITLVAAAAAAWPQAARAQQPPMPVIGFLHSASLEPNAKRLAGFRKGLQRAGFVEGQNVTIEFRWAAGQNDRLPDLAAELVGKPVNVIATLSSTPATRAAKAATNSIPIVFLIAEDPVELGLVASLNRPGGNATGISSQNAELVAKRLGLLRELLPQAPNIAVLLNPANPNAKPISSALQSAAATLGVPLNVLEATTDADIERAYHSLKPGSPLLVGTDPSFFARRAALVALGAKYAIPTMYDNREAASAGGLMSYGQNTESSWEQAGIMVGRILKGAKPGELPVMQPTTFEYVINMKTAKALGVDVPLAMQARADEVIE
jgi:putative tryptophan/tyrosine transport system substrate-binding protein